MNRRLPIVLAALTFAALFATQAGVGFVRDEGYYFEAARSYEQWVALLLRAPAAALRETGRYWSVNFEHPGLAKLLFALSHLVFTTWLRWLPDALSCRLPAFVFGALLDLSIWTPLRGAPALSWRPGIPAAEVAAHFGRFYLLTSLAYDGFRAAGNALMVLLLGPPILAALARLRARFSFEVVAIPELEAQAPPLQ